MTGMIFRVLDSILDFGRLLAARREKEEGVCG